MVKVDMRAAFDSIVQEKLWPIVESMLTDDENLVYTVTQSVRRFGRIQLRKVLKASRVGGPAPARYDSVMSVSRQKVLEVLMLATQSRLVTFERKLWQQTGGIPQGSVVS